MRDGRLKEEQVKVFRRINPRWIAVVAALAITPTRKGQIEQALKTCREAWEKGYTDRAR